MWTPAAELYKGHVDSIAGATGPLFSVLPPENATGNYVKIVQRIPVKIVLDPGENRDRQLRPGMNVVPEGVPAMSVVADSHRRPGRLGSPSTIPG